MGTTFPKDIMDCMKGCILSIFWPKKDIVDFMKKVGCTSRELMPESEYKELHRAEIVDKIFTNFILNHKVIFDYLFKSSYMPV